MELAKTSLSHPSLCCFTLSSSRYCLAQGLRKVAVQFAKGSVAHQLAYDYPCARDVSCSAQWCLSAALELVSIDLAVVKIWPCARCTATAQALAQPLRKGCTATAQGLYKPFSYVVRDYSLHHRCLHYCYHCLHCLHHCDVLLLYLDTARHQKKRPNSETTDLGAFLTLTIFGYLLITKKAPISVVTAFGRFFEF